MIPHRTNIFILGTLVLLSLRLDVPLSTGNGTQVISSAPINRRTLAKNLAWNTSTRYSDVLTSLNSGPEYLDGVAKELNRIQWGIDRIDQRTNNLDGQYTVPEGGADTWVYLFSYGVRTSHEQFEGRALPGYDFITMKPNVANDCDGRGTHQAAIIAGSSYGVARKARLVAVRVLDCKKVFRPRVLLKATEWLVNDVQANNRKRAVLALMVEVNMTRPVNEALNAVVNAGIPVVLPAGDDGIAGCYGTWVGTRKTIAVGATSRDDYRIPSSNHGNCSDIYAPGFHIRSAWRFSDSSYSRDSGSKVAAAHVAGIVAVLMSSSPLLPAHRVKEVIQGSSVQNVVKNGTATVSPGLAFVRNISRYQGQHPARENMFTFFSIQALNEASACNKESKATLHVDLSSYFKLQKDKIRVFCDAADVHGNLKFIKANNTRLFRVRVTDSLWHTPILFPMIERLSSKEFTFPSKIGIKLVEMPWAVDFDKSVYWGNPKLLVDRPSENYILPIPISVNWTEFFHTSPVHNNIYTTFGYQKGKVGLAGQALFHFAFAGPRSQVTISTCLFSTFDTYILLLNGNPRASVQVKTVAEADNDASCSDIRRSTITSELEPGDYYVVVTGKGKEWGQFAIQVKTEALFSGRLPWGLDRINQRTLPLDGTQNNISSSRGADVWIYLIDSGVRVTHLDFQGRAKNGFDALSNTRTGNSDCSGHGTHSAGVMIGNRFGVAKKSNLVSVRVFDCNGLSSTIHMLNGLRWIKEDIARFKRKRVIIALMDLEIKSDILREVVQTAGEDSVVVLPGGDQNASTCPFSQQHQNVLTVGAVDRNDFKERTSNFGDCARIFAPGHDIPGPWYSTDNATHFLSGTRTAAAHVVGILSEIMGYNKSSTAKEGSILLSRLATKDVIKGVSSSMRTHLAFLPNVPDENSKPLLNYAWIGFTIKLFPSDQRCSELGSSQIEAEVAAVVNSTTAATNITNCKSVLKPVGRRARVQDNGPEISFRVSDFQNKTEAVLGSIRSFLRNSSSQITGLQFSVTVPAWLKTSGGQTSLYPAQLFSKELLRIPSISIGSELVGNTLDETIGRFSSFSRRDLDVGRGGQAFFKFQVNMADVDRDMTISTCSFANFDTYLVLFSNNPRTVQSPTEISENDDDISCVANKTRSTIRKRLVPGTYYILVTGKQAQEGRFNLSLQSLKRPKVALPWGLDRLNQRALPLDRQFKLDSEGDGIWIYALSTGVRISHSEFGGRAFAGYDFIKLTPGVAVDCNGQGTHTAALIAGATFGVAKRSNIVAVRVLDCGGQGKLSAIINAMEWVLFDSKIASRKPAILYASVNVRGSPSFDTAVAGIIERGIPVILPAGNDGRRVCPNAVGASRASLFVGSTQPNDFRSPHSNDGNCTDVFAPGSSIPSAWYTSDAESRNASGTAQAAAQVAGIVGILLETSPKISSKRVKTVIESVSTVGVVKNSTDDKGNRLAYVRSVPKYTGRPPPREMVYIFFSLTIESTVKCPSAVISTLRREIAKILSVANSSINVECTNTHKFIRKTVLTSATSTASLQVRVTEDERRASVTYTKLEKALTSTSNPFGKLNVKDHEMPWVVDSTAVIFWGAPKFSVTPGTRLSPGAIAGLTLAIIGLLSILLVTCYIGYRAKTRKDEIQSMEGSADIERGPVVFDDFKDEWARGGPMRSFRQLARSMSGRLSSRRLDSLRDSFQDNNSSSFIARASQRGRNLFRTESVGGEAFANFAEQGRPSSSKIDQQPRRSRTIGGRLTSFRGYGNQVSSRMHSFAESTIDGDIPSSEFHQNQRGRPPQVRMHSMGGEAFAVFAGIDQQDKGGSEGGGNPSRAHANAAIPAAYDPGNDQYAESVGSPVSFRPIEEA